MSDVRIFVVAGEHSGDRLGGKLLAELRSRLGDRLKLAGVGAEDIERQGLKSLFPMDEIAVMGIGAVVRRLPSLLRRIRETAAAAVSFDPHVLVIIDSPDFTHRVARAFKKLRPGTPVIDYVSPTVWAWRPGRAKVMARYIDHVLALLPFEPEAHGRLGGPPCTYVGHPIVERLPWIANLDPDELRARWGLDPEKKILVVLPGSRRTEVVALMPVFAETIARVEQQVGPLELILPLVESVEPLVEAGLASWPHRPHIARGEADKFSAFRLADAALAASGTVTLELAAAGTPMVVGYIAQGVTRLIQPLIKVPSVVLANLILGENAFPEFIQAVCTPENLSRELAPILVDGPARQAQLAALARIPALMAPPATSPSAAAADVVMAAIRPA